MNQEEITIRKTPFLFLKWLVIIEFFFALLPFLAVILTSLRQTYDDSTMAFNKMIGVELRRFVDVSFPEIESRQICVISVQPSSEPAFLTHKGKEVFYVRTGNSSQPLSVSKATRYIQDRFGQ